MKAVIETNRPITKIKKRSNAGRKRKFDFASLNVGESVTFSCGVVSLRKNSINVSGSARYQLGAGNYVMRTTRNTITIWRKA